LFPGISRALFSPAQLKDKTPGAYHTVDSDEEMNMFLKLIRVLPCLLLLLSLSAVCSGQDKKTAFALFVDNSGSMRHQFADVIKISRAVVGQVHTQGPVSIFNFTSQGRLQDAKAVVHPLIEQSQDERVLQETVDDIFVLGGQTTLLDAIEFIADRLKQPAADNPSESVIVLITDGEDRKSSVKLKELIAKLKEQKTRVYAVGLVQDLSKTRSQAVDLLSTLTKETGGRAVFPKTSGVDPQQLISELGIGRP
jgi:uncharacterized protein with von Willebrand factor type A (vWA) domain